jgi:hypothetical protein
MENRERKIGKKIGACYGNTTWPLIINTLNQELCAAGLIEKGLVGELAARALLLIARDYATLALVDSGSPPAASGVTVGSSSLPLATPDLLIPVNVFSFLHHLLGQPLPLLDSAFDGTYVNFTHWILTRDSLPEPEYADRSVNYYMILHVRFVYFHCSGGYWLTYGLAMQHFSVASTKNHLIF